MNPSHIITPFTTIYDRNEKVEGDDGSIIYHVGRHFRYEHNVRRNALGMPHLDVVESRIVFRNRLYYHNVDRTPAYKQGQRKTTWDVGGLMFCQIFNGEGEESAIYINGIRRFETRRVENTDYDAAVDLWHRTFGDDWIQTIAHDRFWFDRWKTIAERHRLRYER